MALCVIRGDGSAKGTLLSSAKEEKPIGMKLWRVVIPMLLIVLGCVQSGLAQRYYTSVERSSKRMEMGISVGASFLEQSAVDGVALSPKLGVKGAISMSLCWYDEYALQMELGYAHNKIEAERGGSLYDVMANVMEIPILFSYRGLGIMRLNAGPVLSLASTARYSNGQEKLVFGNMRSTLGYAAGIGVELTPKVLIDARLTGNFKSQSNYFEGAEFRSSGLWLTLGVGYMF